MTSAPAAECIPPVRPGYRPRPVRGYASGKEDYLRRLRKTEGQVRGLQKMIEADSWCPDVVTQIASATRALQEVAVGLLNDHISHCVMAAASGAPDEGGAQLDEVAATIGRLTNDGSRLSPAGRSRPRCLERSTAAAAGRHGRVWRCGLTVHIVITRLSAVRIQLADPGTEVARISGRPALPS